MAYRVAPQSTGSTHSAVSAAGPGWFRPYDPVDSPGPIPAVVAELVGRPRDPAAERARRRTELARYAVVLVTPPAADLLGLDGEEAGLVLYIDGLCDGRRATFHDVVRDIERYSGIEVELVEHRADLVYWTPMERRVRRA